MQKFGGFVHYDWEFVDGPVKVPRGNLLWKPTWGKLTPGTKAVGARLAEASRGR